MSRNTLVAAAQKQAQPDQPNPPGAVSPAAPQAQMIATQGPAKTISTSMFETLKRFSASDYLGWISEYLRYRFGPKHPFLTYDGKSPADGIYQLAADGGEIRLGLAGDWGTGTDEAYRIGQLIAAFDPHYTIHLGDVYFVGDEAEVGANFLGQSSQTSGFTPCKWPQGSRASFALNGNHEMLARGFAYFDRILPAMGEMQDGVPQGQQASFFCLMNDDWCILGLDTGYMSVGLPIIGDFWQPDASLPKQIETWLRSIAIQTENRAIIVMTHHQVLSVYDDCFTRQADQIFAILQRPVLWFWGHEHRLVIYQPFAAQGRSWPMITGRCIGHGGMPVDLPGVDKPGRLGSVEYIDERVYANDENLHVGVNGMVLMKIDGPKLHVDYVDVFGKSVFAETFTAQAGIPARLDFTNLQLAKP